MARKKKRSLDDLVREVEEWLKDEPKSTNQDILTELLSVVLGLARSDFDRGDLKVLVRSLREMRRAFRLFARYRGVRKVSIFGSARVPESDPYYALAVDFARRIAEEDFMVITGAGEGIMQAGHEGAGTAKSIGVNIKLPFEQFPNRFIQGDSKHMPFHFFFTRKLMFVKEGDAFAFFPGGFGTHDEALEVLTLTQTGKSQIVPIVMVDLPGRSYWSDWLAFVNDRLLADGYISPEDLSIFRIVDSAEAAVAEIKRFYRNFHSYRYVKRQLVMRLMEAPPPHVIRALNENFRDILTGEITDTGPLPEEMNDAATLSYPRILVPFNRRNFGRLRQMIDVINGED